MDRLEGYVQLNVALIRAMQSNDMVKAWALAEELERLVPDHPNVQALRDTVMLHAQHVAQGKTTASEESEEEEEESGDDEAASSSDEQEEQMPSEMAPQSVHSQRKPASIPSATSAPQASCPVAEEKEGEKESSSEGEKDPELERQLDAMMTQSAQDAAVELEKLGILTRSAALRKH